MKKSSTFVDVSLPAQVDFDELRDFLDRMVKRYNQPAFIETDPICIPHAFTKLQDIEVAGFLTATIAWGQRPVILRNAHALMQRMDHAPHDFIINADQNDLRKLSGFVHRTFNDTDAVALVKALQYAYKQYNSLEEFFINAFAISGNTMREAIVAFREVLLQLKHPLRIEKHIADPSSGSSAKRINMWLRWMIRKDLAGVDFGCWKKINPSLLYCPLDVHSGNVARKLGLLKRTSNNWKAVEELTSFLRLLDQHDPVKYDFALFGLGAFEGW
jgi:uncharacterized protein (TIGR02757 family)